MTSADLSDGADGRVTEPLRSRRNHWNNQVRRHALTIPDAPALKYAGKVTTWSELDARSHAFAAALHRRGVGFGDRCCCSCSTAPEYVEAIFGANILGAIAVPVNIRMAPAEIAFLVSDSGAKVVVTETLLAPLAGAVQAAAPGIEQIIVVGGSDSPAHLDYETLLAEGADDLPEIDVPEESVALIMYTSGTTGKPKGAMLTHQNMQAQAVTCLRVSCRPAPTTSGRWWCRCSTSPRSARCRRCSTWALSVIHPLGAFDPNELLDALETERTTSIFLVPVQWQAVRRPAGQAARSGAAHHQLGCGARLGHRAQSDGRDVPGCPQRRGVRPDRDVADHLCARRRTRSASSGRSARPSRRSPRASSIRR